MASETRKLAGLDNLPPADATVEATNDPEIAALVAAYAAITSQPHGSRTRMVNWLAARIASDLKRDGADDNG